MNEQISQLQSTQATETQNLNLLLENTKKDAEAIRVHEEEVAREKAVCESTIQELRTQISQLQIQHQQTLQQLVQLQQQQTLQHARVATPSPSLSSYRPHISSSATLPSPFFGIGTPTSSTTSSPGSTISNSSFPPSPSPFPGYVQSPSLRSSTSYSHSPFHHPPIHGASPLGSSTRVPPTPASSSASAYTTPISNSSSSQFNSSSHFPSTTPPGGTPFASPSHNVLRNSEFSIASSTSDLFAPRSAVELQVCIYYYCYLFLKLIINSFM